MRLKITLQQIMYLLFGILIGLAGYTFYFARGWAYLSDDPQACINCHVMKEQFESWSKSTHHHVAKCNDCHLPHGIIGKYAIKSLNGFNHSAAFTLQNFPEPIRAKEFSKKIIKNSCVSCHEPMTHVMTNKSLNNPQSEEQACLHCHRSVGHAR